MTAELLDLDLRLGELLGSLARSWVDTPYYSTGREKGRAADCVGVLLGVAWEAGLTRYDERAYSPEDAPRLLADGLARFCREVEPDAPLLAGDIPFMRIGKSLRHVGIISDRLTLVHAHTGAKRVVEITFTGSKWSSLTASRFRWALDTSETVEAAREALGSRKEVF